MDKTFIDAVLNATAFDSTGEKVGSVSQMFVDDQTKEPTFVAVNTGLFGMSSSLVPLEGARLNGEELHLAHTKDAISDAPNIDDSDEGLTPEQENTLFRHYGLTSGATTGESADADNHRAAAAEARTATTDVDEHIVRSEEQLNVRKHSEEAGRVRLRKYVVTDTENIEVPVSREEVRIEREPISAEEAARLGDSRINEQEAELILHQERVTVDKDVVPVEKISLNKETVTDTHVVSEEVREERIDVDTDGDVEKRHQ
ncbi:MULTISPECIES: YsnF/AvaK domain-containing protein [unclassified Corynebacterium]|uniref:YsnF/AvaK domain-containing protein n=1 Tax=unclassified Corynebacterium TaxID=2624378 RepID=UPI003523636A